MGQVIKVGMADLNICKEPDILTTIGLGSCIGIALYDPTTKISGLAHITKFADTGIQKLYDDMIKAGANRNKIIAKIAGGAKMFELSNANAQGINIGEKNAVASRQKLKALGIPLVAEDTGLNFGRTVELYSETGQFKIKSVGRQEKFI